MSELPATLRGPVRAASLASQVSEQFRELIASGRWAVGQKIPGEHELAEELAVSRATVREALRGLTVIGLLEPRIGDGTYVRATNEITGVLVRDHFTAALGQVLDARAGLEAASARLAAQHAGPDALAELTAALDARTAAHEAGDLAGYVDADLRFHRAVVQAGANPLLVRLHTAVDELVGESITHTAVLPEDPAVGEAHRRLAGAIRDGRPEAAAALAYELIESVKATVAPA
jgi:DNA-binding FadR family transcriptional regulator